MASAVLLSTLGAAGTILGAALGSIVVTVLGAYFSAGLSSSARTLAKAQAEARQKVGIAEAEVHRAARAEDPDVRGSHLDHAEERLSQANRELDEAVAAGNIGWRSQLAGLPWRRISWVSAGLFVTALAAITLFELIVGQPVSSFTGGTSGGGTTVGDVRNDVPAGPEQGQPTEPPSPDTSPGPTGVPGAPESPQPTPTETPTVEATPAETPTETPTLEATPTETTSPTDTADPEPFQSPTP